MKNKLLVNLLLALLLALTFTTALPEEAADVHPHVKMSLIGRSLSSVSPEVTQKVQQLKQQCLAACSTDYDKALWMHDWLIYNATYDYNFEEYGPEGVLLKGTGVCQSYAEAYKLLMDSVGISCEVLYAPVEMDHAWNLVYLNGVWCHVDVTWDDPGTGGYENHFYFGMNDTLIGRDHDWNRSAYRKCTSLANYYPQVRGGSHCVDSEQAMQDYLNAQAANEVTELDIVYVGSDSSFDIVTAFSKWLSVKKNMYGITQYSSTYSDYQITLKLRYGGTTGEDGGDPEDQIPFGALVNPVPAPDFNIDSPRGTYKLSNYLGKNGVVLIFGRPVCGNTHWLLKNLHSSVKSLYSQGVEVIVSLTDTLSTPADFDELTTELPNYHYANWSSVYNAFDAAITPYDNTRIFPFVYIINSKGQIVYWSHGNEYDLNELISTAESTATGKKLPEPVFDTEPVNTPASANVKNITASAVKTGLLNACSQHEHVYFIIDYTMYNDDEALLQDFESNYSLYQQLGYQVVTWFYTAQDMTDYPHVIDLSNDEYYSFLFDLLEECGASGGASWTNCYAIESNGHITSYASRRMLNLHNELVRGVNALQCGYVAPKALTKIEAEAFARNKVVSVDLTTAKVTSIGSKAFANCKKLTVVKIPATVKTIADDAFTGCGSDLTIVCPYLSPAYYYARNHGISYITK